MSLDPTDPTSDSNYEVLSADANCNTTRKIFYLIGRIELVFSRNLSAEDRAYLRFFKKLATLIANKNYEEAYNSLNHFLIHNTGENATSTNFRIFWLIAKGIASFLICSIKRAAEMPVFTSTEFAYARNIIRLYENYDSKLSIRSSQSQTFVPDTSGGGGGGSASATSSSTSTSGGGAAVEFVDNGLEGVDSC